MNYIDLVYSVLPRPHLEFSERGVGMKLSQMQSCIILCHYILVHDIGSVVGERTNYNTFFQNIVKISTNIKTPFVITIKRELYYLPYKTFLSMKILLNAKFKLSVISLNRKYNVNIRFIFFKFEIFAVYPYSCPLQITFPCYQCLAVQGSPQTGLVLIL